MHKLNIGQFSSLAARSLMTVTVFLVVATGAIAQSTGGLKGKVRNTRDEGIAGASVTARQKGADVKTVTADAKGNFVLEGLEPGLYNLVFDGDGYASGVLYNVEVKKQKTADLGSRLTLSADRGSQVIVNGSVFYKEGTSVTGAKVDLEKVNSDGSTQRLGSGYTSVNGEFTFRLRPGTAKLRVTTKVNGVTGSKEIEVSDAAIYRLAITLDLSRTEK